MRTKISVVIPTFNRATMLAHALKSVVDQTLRPDEVIVVDDGSTDATESVVARFQRFGARYLRIENAGTLHARNVGLRAARSRLVAFCDSDDLWHPTLLQAASDLWHRVPGMAASYTNFSTVRDGRWSEATKFDTAPPGFWSGMAPIAPGFGVIDQNFAAQLIDFQPFFPTGMVVERDSFIALGGWDEGVSRIVGSDFATVLRVAERPPVGVIQRPLVGIRKHGGNISGNAELMNLGNAHILEYVLATRPPMRRLSDKIAGSVAARRRDALCAAFARHDLEAVRAIYRMLPKPQRASVRLKVSLAALPAPLSLVANEVALWIGSSKSSLASLMF